MDEKELFNEFGKIMHQFKGLKFKILLEEVSTREFMTMNLMATLEKKIHSDKVPMSMIIDSLKVKPQGISRTFRYLEEKKLILRQVDEKNHRNMQVSLTDYGREVLEKYRKVMFEYTMEVFSKMDKDEMEHMISTWKKLIAVMEETLQERIDSGK